MTKHVQVSSRLWKARHIAILCWLKYKYLPSTKPHQRRSTLKQRKLGYSLRIRLLPPDDEVMLVLFNKAYNENHKQSFLR